MRTPAEALIVLLLLLPAAQGGAMTLTRLILVQVEPLIIGLPRVRVHPRPLASSSLWMRCAVAKGEPPCPHSTSRRAPRMASDAAHPMDRAPFRWAVRWHRVGARARPAVSPRTPYAALQGGDPECASFTDADGALARDSSMLRPCPKTWTRAGQSATRGASRRRGWQRTSHLPRWRSSLCAPFSRLFRLCLRPSHAGVAPPFPPSL
jgi:hypothetical protein